MRMVRIPRLLDDTDEKNTSNSIAEETEVKKALFGRRDCTEKAVMILSLNREKKTERIIIGEQLQVDCWLAQCGGGEFYYDVERPLGTLLLEYRSMKSEHWNENAGGLLMESLRNMEDRSELEEEAWSFLERKMCSQDPIIKFTAYQCWSWYHKYRKLQGETDLSQKYADDFLGLSVIYSFGLNVLFDDTSLEYDCDIKKAWDRVRHCVEEIGTNKDTQLNIRYSEQEKGSEWLLITESFYPVLQYYLKQLMTWKLIFCKCSICGKMFLAPSRHYSLCSRDCRAEQNRENKRQFDFRARGNGYDIDYKNFSQRMRNRLNKLKKQEGISDEKRIEAEVKFDEFRKEAIRRKKTIKTDEDRKAYQDWLFEEERKFEKICVF